MAHQLRYVPTDGSGWGVVEGVSSTGSSCWRHRHAYAICWSGSSAARSERPKSGSTPWTTRSTMLTFCWALATPSSWPISCGAFSTRRVWNCGSCGGSRGRSGRGRQDVVSRSRKEGPLPSFPLHPCPGLQGGVGVFTSQVARRVGRGGTLVRDLRARGHLGRSFSASSCPFFESRSSFERIRTSRATRRSCYRSFRASRTSLTRSTSTGPAA